MCSYQAAYQRAIQEEIDSRTAATLNFYLTEYNCQSFNELVQRELNTDMNHINADMNHFNTGLQPNYPSPYGDIERQQQHPHQHQPVFHTTPTYPSSSGPYVYANIVEPTAPIVHATRIVSSTELGGQMNNNPYTNNNTTVVRGVPINSNGRL